MSQLEIELKILLAKATLSQFETERGEYYKRYWKLKGVLK